MHAATTGKSITPSSRAQHVSRICNDGNGIYAYVHCMLEAFLKSPA